MADFKQALKWMKKGKRVKRKIWKKIPKSSSFDNSGKYPFFCWGDGAYEFINDSLYEDVTATDWEIFEEWKEMTNREIVKEFKFDNTAGSGVKPYEIEHHANPNFKIEKGKLMKRVIR